MENKIIREWIERVIWLDKESVRERLLTNDIRTCYHPQGIHMANGIERVAEALELPLKKKCLKDSKVLSAHGIEFYFFYHGTRIFQLGRSEYNEQV